MRKRQKTGLLLGACVLSIGMSAASVFAYTVAVSGNGEEMKLVCPECGASADFQEAAGTELSVDSDANSYYYTWETDKESAVTATATESSDTVVFRDTEREKEYEAVGITAGRNGSWFYDGREISFLLDENNSVYSASTEEKEKLYVYVSRDEDGKVEKAQVVSGGELIERMAELDDKE